MNAQSTIHKLETLKPWSADFYDVAAGYFRQRYSRTRRLGHFVVGISVVVWIATMKCWHSEYELLPSMLFGFFIMISFFGWGCTFESARRIREIPEDSSHFTPDVRRGILKAIVHLIPSDRVSAQIREIELKSATTGSPPI